MNTHHTNPAQRIRGFTAIEFILVIAITGILVVGLAAIVEMPAEVVQRQQDGESSSGLDQTLAVFDKDVRFAIDVTAPDTKTLQITKHGGASVTWQWSGVTGATLTRTDSSGTVGVVPNTRALGFAVNTTPHRVSTVSTVGTVKTDTVGAVFNNFTVKSGYQLLDGVVSIIRGLTSVTETVGTRTLSATNNVGLFFKVPSGAQDKSYPSTITVRLSRGASGDVLVRCFEATAVPRLPDRANAVAMAYVRNADLPATMSDVTIKLSPLKRVSGDGSYFVDFVGRNGAAAANFEFRKLSLDAAATDWGGGLLYSTTSGASYAPITSLLANSQTKFTFALAKEQDADEGDTNDTVATTTVQIPTGVTLDLAIQGEGGAQRSVRISVPIENNVQLVNQ